ncbi:MAG: hypothetical protein HY889_07335 [Deltaproteobacteria bacterium]|nr:hypothetical protein [Deltaproteobacteria bacterium]
MFIAGPLIVFLISAIMTPVFNYMVVSRPEAVYPEQVSSIRLDTKNPFYAEETTERPFYLTGVVSEDQGRGDKKPALKVALMDGKIRELKANNLQ